jgi:hypothetical protein
MPCLKQPPTLEEAAISSLVTRVCFLCNAVEELEAKDSSRAHAWAEDLAKLFAVFPGRLLAKLVEPAVVHIMEKVCHRRGHKGVPTLLKCLLQPSSTELNLSGLFFKSRLPADVNRKILVSLPLSRSVLNSWTMDINSKDCQKIMAS